MTLCMFMLWMQEPIVADNTQRSAQMQIREFLLWAREDHKEAVYPEWQNVLLDFNIVLYTFIKDQ